jgi:bifunctional oligoribonuclease and PAP phosphatase NrnA
MYFDSHQVEGLAASLATPSQVVILTHRNPDGDAMGSTLGLCRVLQARGHKATVIIPNPYGHFLAWMPGVAESVDATAQPAQALELIRTATHLFCLDFSALNRIEQLGEAVRAAGGIKVLIDHHTQPEDFAAFTFHRLGVSSTAELVYLLLRDLGWHGLVDKDAAACLYTGIMTDTGSFRYSGTTATLHRVVADLMDTGLDIALIHTTVYDNFSEPRMRFLGYCLHEKLKVLPEFRTAYMCITHEECKRFHISDGDTEGIVNYNLSIEGIRFGVLIIGRDDRVKLSFRSIGNFPCNDFAAHFNGGGHPNASGGQSKLSLAETEALFLSLLPSFQTQLLAP